MSPPTTDVTADSSASEPLLSVSADHEKSEIDMETTTLRQLQAARRPRGFWSVASAATAFLALVACIVVPLSIVASMAWAAITITAGFGLVACFTHITHKLIAPAFAIHPPTPAGLRISDYLVYLKVGLAGYVAVGAAFAILCSLTAVGVYILYPGGLTKDRKEMKRRGRLVHEMVFNHPKYGFRVRMASNAVVALLGAVAIPIGSWVVRWWYGPDAGDELLVKNFQAAIAMGLLGSVFILLVNRERSRGKEKDPSSDDDTDSSV